MKSLRRSCSLGAWLSALAVALLVTAWQVPQAPAAEKAKTRPAKPAATTKAATSLDFVPENAAFYSAALRGREQWQAIVNSRAWAKLKAMPLVKMAEGLWTTQATLNAESVPAKIEEALKAPETRKLLDLGADMVSQEVFVYGDQSISDVLELLQMAAGTARLGPAMAKLSGEALDADPTKARAMAMLSALAENTSLMKVPDMVVGFKLKNAALAKEQLERLDKLVSEQIAEEPQLKDRWKKVTVADNQYLTLSLDGSMIPWDEIPWDDVKEEFESSKGDIDKIIARVKEMKLVVALGLRNDYLLLSIGSSTDVLARLGQGKPLGTRPEFAPLKKFAGERLTSIGYVSKTMMTRLGTNKQDIDSVQETVESALKLAGAPEALQKDLRKDLPALAKDLKGLITEPGASMSFGFLTASGKESYSYDWSEHPAVDASKPLTLLNHVGGNPMLASVDRSKVSVQDYDLLAKWAAVAYGYLEKHGVPQMPPDVRGEFQKFMTDAIPLIKRLDEANRKMLLPALAEGQTGLVIDTKLASKQFIQALPPTEQAMPMIEPALVFGVSDAALLRKALAEYRAVADGLLAAAKKIKGNPLPPNLKIPDAKAIDTPAGTIYAYALPKAWGVDPKIVPNGGLSEKVAVLSISRDHSERLLKATPPTVAGRTIPTDRPLAGMTIFDINALIDAVTPWVDLAIEKAMENESGGPIDAASAREQARTVLDVLKVFRNVTSETYLEDKALVRHTRTEIRDVK